MNCARTKSWFGKISIAVLFALSLGEDAARSANTDRTARPLPDFSYTQGWLGADDAYSVPLKPDTSVWLFGDTFVGYKDTKLRSQSTTMARNSVGISVCKPGATCTMEYFWQKPYTSKPRSFFDTGTDDLWYWPMDGYLRAKTLYVALMAVRNKPNAKPEEAFAFGFEIAGTKLATIDNAQASPEKWHIAIQDLTGSRLWAGTSIIPDGKYLLWYTHVNVAEGQGYMVAMRIPIDKVANPSAAWEYLRKDNHWAAGLAGDDALHVIDQPISEMSVRYHPSIKKWLALSTGPEFPSPRVVARTADSPIGPWSNPQTIYEFPEMKRDTAGYDKDTFCYAVKEHIEFSETQIALTYVCNSMALAKTLANMNIYRPMPVVLPLPK
jgi:hypothetical protein